MAKLLILAPLLIETRAAARALGVKTRINLRPVEIATHPTPIQLHMIGLRAARLADVGTQDITAVILTGLAGALDPALVCGNVVVDAESWPGFETSPGFQSGKIHGSDVLVPTPAAKAKLRAQTGASAVDMESHIVRAWARQHGLPLLIVRAILDTASEKLDPTTLGFVDETGRVKPTALAAALIRRPATIARLKRLGAASDRAATAMGRALSQILQMIPTP
jgi:adenosylhomocysteine nucleosidase